MHESIVDRRFIERMDAEAAEQVAYEALLANPMDRATRERYNEAIRVCDVAQARYLDALIAREAPALIS